MKHFVATPASEGHFELGEGPVWDADRELVWWVDILSGEVWSGSLVGHTVQATSSVVIDDTVGAIALGPAGELLVAGRHDLFCLDPAAGVRRVASVVPSDRPDRRSRLNDGGCDPAGRFLIGSVRQDGRQGDDCLYRWEFGGDVTVLDDDLTVSNGLAWSADGSVMWSVDSIPGVVWRRSYDVATGACGEREAWLRITDGLPDGLCLDGEGNLWVAIWGLGQVRCYQPDGTQIAAVSVDAPHTSSVAFVGRDHDLLLITTAQEELSPEQLLQHPHSGRLFIVDVGVSGLPTQQWTGPTCT